MDSSKELARLATYSSWQSGMSPLVLAKSGFSFIGRDDEVECFQCKTRISGWNEGDNVEERHRQVAPRCRLLNGNSTSNVPTDLSVPVSAEIQSNQMEHDEARDPLTITLHEATSRAQRNGIVFNNNVRAIDRTQPDFNMLQTEAERRSTFYDWPSNANADPDALAQAGFYYTGTGDRVQCFKCKGGVLDWEPSDVPISEHRRLYPNCPFVNHLDSSDSDEDNCVVDRSGQPAVQVQQHQKMPSTKASNLIEREVKAKMNTPTVLAVLDMGYSDDKVEAVIETRLLTTGEDFPDVNCLLEALFCLEEAETSISTGTSATSFASEDVNYSVYR